MNHMEWCKERALAYLDQGDCANAIASFLSDTQKDPETKDLLECPLGGFMLVMGINHANSGNTRGLRDWITGWANVGGERS